MRLRTPSEPATAVPARKAMWWQRWFRRKTLRAQPSDVVETARVGRTVTIATALITVLAGAAGTIITATLSYETGARQLASDREKSETDFFRKQRQEAYAAFGAEMNSTFVVLRDGNALISPSKPPPKLEDFNRQHDDEMRHLAKFSELEINMDLVASEDVCAAAKRNWDAFTDAFGNFDAAWPYVAEGKPPDDDYRKLWMPYENFHAIQDMVADFTRAAR
jgi:hypothetical protein